MHYTYLFLISKCFPGLRVLRNIRAINILFRKCTSFIIYLQFWYGNRSRFHLIMNDLCIWIFFINDKQNYVFFQPAISSYKQQWQVRFKDTKKRTHAKFLSVFQAFGFCCTVQYLSFSIRKKKSLLPKSYWIFYIMESYRFLYHLIRVIQIKYLTKKKWQINCTEPIKKSQNY